MSNFEYDSPLQASLNTKRLSGLIDNLHNDVSDDLLNIRESTPTPTPSRMNKRPSRKPPKVPSAGHMDSFNTKSVCIEPASHSSSPNDSSAMDGIIPAKSDMYPEINKPSLPDLPPEKALEYARKVSHRVSSMIEDNSMTPSQEEKPLPSLPIKNDNSSEIIPNIIPRDQGEKKNLSHIEVPGAINREGGVSSIDSQIKEDIQDLIPMAPPPRNKNRLSSKSSIPQEQMIDYKEPTSEPLVSNRSNITPQTVRVGNASGSDSNSNNSSHSDVYIVHPPKITSASSVNDSFLSALAEPRRSLPNLDNGNRYEHMQKEDESYIKRPIPTLPIEREGTLKVKQKNDTTSKATLSLESDVTPTLEKKPEYTRKTEKRKKKRSNQMDAFDIDTLSQLLEVTRGTLVGSEFSNLGLPIEEKRLLEKLVDSLSRLSADMVLDPERHDEGLKRLAKATKALDGF